MKHRSAKRRRHDELIEPLVTEYRWLFPACQYPGCRARATDIHEIARGPARKAARGNRAAMLHLCRCHHVEVQNWPTVRQLALKLLADPVGYDRVEVLRLCGRQPGWITEEEVRCQTIP